MELHFGFDQIRNIARDGALVHFEVKLGRRWGVVDFTTPDDDVAASLVAALPGHGDAGSVSTWRASRQFMADLEALPGRVRVTPVLVVANLLAYVALCIKSDGLVPGLSEVIRLGGNAGLLTSQGEWWRWLTSVFLHFGLAHLLLNLWALWHAGRLTERLYGSGPYLAIYLASGVLASMSSTVWNPAPVSAGASGAIFGVLGALLAFVRRGNGLPPSIVRAHRLGTVVFVGANLLLGAFSPNIDNAAHVGGLLSGFALGAMLGRQLTAGRRSEFPRFGVTGAVGSTVMALLVGIGLCQAPDPRPDSAAAWVRANGRYVDGESAAMRHEAQLSFQLAAGQRSPAAYAEGLRREVLPFYESAVADLQKRGVPASHETTPTYAELVDGYSLARRDWLKAVADASGSADDPVRDETSALERRAHEAEARLELRQLHERFADRPLGVRFELVDRWRRYRATHGFDCTKPPEGRYAVAIDTDATDDGPARQRDLRCEAQRRLLLGDHGWLEQRLASTFAVREDLPDGSSSFDAILDGLDDLFEHGRIAPDEHLARLSRWRLAHPQSPYPALLEVMAIRAAGWAVRGGGYAQTVSAQQWQMFRASIDLARAALVDAVPAARRHPQWYALSIDTALDASRPLDEIHAVFDEGWQAHPDYRPLHAAMIRVLLPRWGGSVRGVAEFLDRTSIGGSNGDYVRLFWVYARYERDNENLFDDGRFSWSRLQDGFGRLLQQYPRSDFWLNAYANLACRKVDAQTYRRLRPELDRRMSSTAWTAETTLQTCDARLLRANADAEAGGGPAEDDAVAVRRQVATALETAEPLRLAIAQYFHVNGRLPPDSVLRSDVRFQVRSPPEVTVTVGGGGAIDMRLNGGSLDGRKFSWTPTERRGTLTWACAQESVPEQFLGPPCR